MTKFEIGDIIYCIYLADAPYKDKIIDIIYDEQIYEGKWFNGAKEEKVKSCYILKCLEKGLLTYLEFGCEGNYKVIGFSSPFCPRCNDSLIEKISEYTNTTIQKCNNCGWC